MKSELKITCIVPTLNRPADIIRLAESFFTAKKNNDYYFEIVLVDNSADSNLSALFSTLDFGVPATYLKETKKGLSNARNCGINYCLLGSDYICTIDDDIIVPIDFFTRLKNTLAKNKDAMIIGGRVELFNPIDLPITIKTEMDWSTFDGINLFGYLFGCCLIINKSVFDEIGLFDINLGAGTKNGGSEDSDLIYRIWQERKKSDRQSGAIIYDPQYFVYHNHGRRELVYANKLNANYQKGQGGFFYKHIFVNKDKYVMKLAWWELQKDLRKIVVKRTAISKWYNRLLGAIYYRKNQ
ncbi:glycosyltransferase [Paraglaciecola sp.]|uniref:glycosyltransferase family 2 protein n=1 Tax=Paraglaciecola sp. TaxID=1920173 RepID=UPI0030F3D799